MNRRSFLTALFCLPLVPKPTTKAGLFPREVVYGMIECKELSEEEKRQVVCEFSKWRVAPPDSETAWRMRHAGMTYLGALQISEDDGVTWENCGHEWGFK